MEKKVKETSIFPLEMFANSPIKPLLDVPSGHLRTGGYVCTDGRGLFRMSISEEYAKPLTYVAEPDDKLKEVLLMLIPTPERAEAMAETLMTLATKMRTWVAEQGEATRTQGRADPDGQ